MQEIYGALKSTNPLMGQEESAVSNGSGLQVWYKGMRIEEWAATDPKYTDKETGFSWYVRDGKHPYMTGEDAAKFKEMCKETGESWLKKFAEMTGTIRHLNYFTSQFQFSNGAFSVTDSGFALDMRALDGRLTPQSSGNMYSDMHKYQFKKVL